MSHHTSLMLRIVLARSSVSMYSSNSPQPESRCGGPAVGRSPKMIALAEASPVSSPFQNGLDAVSARKCGRYAASALTTGIALVPSRSPTWTCTPKV